MQTRSRPTGPRTRTASTAERLSLAVAHADALYRPTPPIECDEDGYPFSDARPMPEGDYHGDVLDYAKGALRARFVDQNVYASTDKFLFLEEGDRRAAVAPDILVAFGPPSGPRQSYKHWEEGKAPDFVLEVLSADNWRNDIERKPALYADLGVREYWTFDPRGSRTDGGPPLEGWRLSPNGPRRAIPASAAGEYRSEVLGLDLIGSGRLLRFRDPETGEILPDHLESEAMRRHESSLRTAAEARAESAEARAESAEARHREEMDGREAAERRLAALEKRLRSQRH